MKNFLEKTLRQNVNVEEYTLIYEKLPLAYRGKYLFFKVETNGMLWFAIQPKQDIGLVTLRKDRNKIEKIVNLNCAIFLISTTFYIKEKLMDEGIPFVIKNKQVYLPFLGYLLLNGNEREIAPVHLMSYLTQKLLLMAIYEKWQNVNVTAAAKKLDVTKMSVSRCFDEIEYLNIGVLGNDGKSRVIRMPSELKLFWERLKPILRNPVIAIYELRDDIKLDNIAGITALCEYSLMSDNEYPTYAITKKEIKNLDIKIRNQVRSGEEIGCRVLELGYFIDFEGKRAEDPLSVELSLTEQEKQDERASISIKKMLEEYVWLRD